jgi:hypothetical protein
LAHLGVVGHPLWPWGYMVRPPLDRPIDFFFFFFTICWKAQPWGEAFRQIEKKKKKKKINWLILGVAIATTTFFKKKLIKYILMSFLK